VILLKKQVAETQHAKDTVATANATKILVASELVEEQVNQPSTADAEKPAKKMVEHESNLDGKEGKENSEKGLISESFDWDDKSVSLDDEGITKIRAFMAILEDEPSVGKVDAMSGQWVDITMKKVYKLFSMTDNDERNHVLDYTHVDLHYVEDQKKNLVNKFNLLK
nr:hypothetical protein [Tanacetum cinerariifolium]